VIRLLIVDDQSLVRTGLRLILDAQPDMTVVGEAADGRAAVALAHRQAVDVVLMDIRMAGVSGLEAARQLAAGGSRGPARVLILTTFDLDEYIDEALSIGTSGFILKSASPEELVAAVRAVAAGEACLAPSVARRVIQAFARRRVRLSREPAELASLTEREREVLRHVAMGLSNREIADTLHVGENTIRTHVAHLLMKLNLRDRTQAAVLAFETGVADRPA
jgi:DNA-binding NarL/FixJ family response regulator